MADSGDDGTCPSHPAIQLRRRQRRTGEWKVILSACPLCASGIPPAADARPAAAGGSAGRDVGRGGSAGRGGEEDGDDNKSVQSSLSYTPRTARSSRSRPDDDDTQSVRSSRSEMPSSSSHRSSSRSRRSGSRSRGSGHGSSSHGGSGHAESRSSSRSRSHHASSSSSANHEGEARSSSRSRGHASRHSAHGGFDAGDDDRSVSSKYSTRSASRNKSRHAEDRHGSHGRDSDRGEGGDRGHERGSDSRDRGDRGNETDEEEGQDDHSHARSMVSRSVSSLSTRPMSNHKQREQEEVQQPMGVRFHPETKPPDERSVVSGSVVSGESSSSNESGGSNSLSESSGGSTSSGREYDRTNMGTHPSHDSNSRGGGVSGGGGIMKANDDPSGGYGIMGGEITGDHLSDRNLDMISNIASAISAANSAKGGGGSGGGGHGGQGGSSRGDVRGVPVPTKGEDNAYRGSVDSFTAGREGYGSEEYATEEEEGSYSSLEDGSRTSSFVDSKQPLPQQVQQQPQVVPVRGVLRPSSFGPTAKKTQEESEEEENPSIPSSRRSSYLSEESGPSVDNNEALVMYQEQDVVEELDEPRRHEEQGQGWGSPAPRQSNAKQARYPPPPRNNGSRGQSSQGGIIRPPSFNDFNDHQSPEYQGKVYDGEPVNTPVEDYGHYEGHGMSPAQQQQQYRPPPRDQSPQVHHDQHSNYHPPPRDHDEERSVHSQGRPRHNNDSRRSSSRVRGRDNDEERSVHSHGRREGRGSQRHSSRPRSRSQSRSRSALRGRDELHDSQTSQPKPVGILRNSKHSKQPPPQSQQVQGPPRGMEPPSPNELLDTSEHSAPTMMHGQHVQQHPQQGRYREPPPEPHRMQQGGRGPPYGSNNGLPQAPRSGPLSYPVGPQGHPMGEYDRPWNAPGGGSQGSPPTKPHKSGKSSSSRDGRSDNYLSQTEPETSVGSREGSDRSNDRMSNANTTGAGNAANPMGAPSEFDDKGRCVKHPHIKLRKKKLMGGWKVLLVNCPDCCIEEMLRMKRENNGGGGGGRGRTKSGGHKGGKRRPSQDGSHSNSSNQSPPISQLTIRTHGQGGVDNSDVESTGSSASEITFNTRTDYSKGSNPSRQGFEDTSGSGGSGPHRVTRMPFTDAYGDKGWYTGDVASGSGLPHGQGTMHYCDGRTREGFWSNGLAGSGGGHRGKNAGQRGPPPTHPPPHRTMRGDGSVNSRSSGNHHLGPPPPQQFSPQPPHRMGPTMHHNSPHHPSPQQQHPPHPHPNLPPPPKQHMPQTNGAVFNMEWTDLRGRDGRYTGETDESGEPHGMGSVRYDEDDTVLEGEWYHGELERRIQGLSVRPAGL